MSSNLTRKILKALTIIGTVYLFLLGIKLLGHSFKMFGGDFAETLIHMTSNPSAGLIIGIVATSLIQSSSTTTSIVVGLVAGGAFTLQSAIPILMGANIGTTITNTLVSMGHVTHRVEFRRAFSASIVHDFFNICAVIVIFPLEIHFHLIEKSAMLLGDSFTHAGGMQLFNPLKAILNPAIDFIHNLFAFMPFESFFLMVLALVFIFASLTFLIKTIQSLMLNKLEHVINNYLFKNDVIGFALGILMTAIVQSSSVTTSLIIPLAGAGVISIRQIFPYTIGANIGTTFTAILAAMTTQNPVAVTAAFSHLLFNIYGILIFYPLRFIPIRAAEFIGEQASTSTRNLVVFITIYILLHFIPVALIFI